MEWIQTIIGGMGWQTVAVIAVIVVMGIMNKESLATILRKVADAIGKPATPTLPVPPPVVTPTTTTPFMDIVALLVSMISKFQSDGNVEGEKAAKTLLDEALKSSGKK